MCILYCLCGFNAWGDTWESAGAEMDEHLLEEHLLEASGG